MCRNRCANEICPSGAENDADKLLSITGGPNPRTYTYDAAGRTKTIVAGQDVTTFDYDYDGRATSITYPNASSDSFGYNGLGARISSSGVNGSKTFRRAGLGVTSSVLSDGTKEYTPGISSRENGVSTFQHSGLKNALDQTDSSQTVTASRHYDAFGNLISETGAWQGPFGYAGDFGYQEDGNGLKLLGHRYYDSDTGRFLTSDPLHSGRNWYTYARNSPIGNIDIAGLQTRKLTYDEWRVVELAINLLERSGKKKEAGDLAKMLMAGMILVDSSLPTKVFAETRYGTMYLNPDLLTGPVSKLKGTLMYDSLVSEHRIRVASILLHEHTHFFQGRANIWNINKREREAYSVEIAWLKAILPLLAPELVGFIEGWITRVEDSARKKGWRPPPLSLN